MAKKTEVKTKKPTEQMPQVTNTRQFKSKPATQANLTTFNKELIDQAKEIGFTEEQINGFKDENSLIQAVAKLNPQFAAVAAQAKRQFEQKQKSQQSITEPPVVLDKTPKEIKSLKFDIEIDYYQIQNVNRATREEMTIQSKYRSAGIPAINLLTIKINRRYRATKNKIGKAVYLTEVEIEYF